MKFVFRTLALIFEIPRIHRLFLNPTQYLICNLRKVTNFHTSVSFKQFWQMNQHVEIVDIVLYHDKFFFKKKRCKPKKTTFDILQTKRRMYLVTFIFESSFFSLSIFFHFLFSANEQ